MLVYLGGFQWLKLCGEIGDLKNGQSDMTLGGTRSLKRGRGHSQSGVSTSRGRGTANKGEQMSAEVIA